MSSATQIDKFWDIVSGVARRCRQMSDCHLPLSARISVVRCWRDISLLFFSVPKFVDLGGRRHPMVNNFSLSHVIFKVNFPHSNDPLALVSEKRQQQCHNTGLSLKSPRLSSFIEFISHILLRIFHSSWLFNAQIFHPDTQAKLQFWDTAFFLLLSVVFPPLVIKLCSMPSAIVFHCLCIRAGKYPVRLIKDVCISCVPAAL